MPCGLGWGVSGPKVSLEMLQGFSITDLAGQSELIVASGDVAPKALVELIDGCHHVPDFEPLPCPDRPASTSWSRQTRIGQQSRAASASASVFLGVQARPPSFT